MANSLGIDFSPQPAYGSNPFEPIQQGINLGFGIQREQREQQKAQQDQQQEIEKMKLLKFGQLADLYKSIDSPVYKAHYYNKTLRPAATQGLGIDLPEQPDAELNDVMDAVAEVYKKYTKGALSRDEYFQTLKDLHAESVIKRDTASQAALEKLIKINEPEKSPSFFFQGFQGQTPIFTSNKSTELISGKPAGAEGTFIPKSEPAKIEEQKILTEGSLSSLEELKTLLKDVPSGLIAGGLSSVTAKLSQGNIAGATKSYLDKKPALAVKIYRDTTGDTRLSDFDANRALAILPDPSEPESVRKYKLRSIKEALEGRNQRLSDFLRGKTSSESSQKPASDPFGLFK